MLLRIGGAVIAIDRARLTIVLMLIACFVIGLLTVVSKLSFSDDTFDVPEPTPIDIFIKRRKIGSMNDAKNIAPQKAAKLEKTKPKLKPELHVVQSPNDKSKATKKNVVRQVEMAMGSTLKLKKWALTEALQDMIGVEKRAADSRYSINVNLSDVTSLDRDLPDTRPPVCTTFHYDIDSLPQVSVIIPFFNEAPTILLRTIHSVLNRSPDSLLQEIILVDDMSFDHALKEPLQKYVDLLPKVSIVRHLKRDGLIVSRMIGARLAKAPVLIFLDAHAEVNVGWLEALLEPLKQNPNQVVQPFIDGIDSKTLDFSAPPTYYRGAFSWDLRYTWLKLTDYEQQRAIETGQPFFTPTLVGCAMAIFKDYFFRMGAFDEGMRVWGGENLELAFRIWMCGGQALTVTCSRVGHMFKQTPHKFDGTEGTKEHTVQTNLIRVADVWLDGMRKFFYATTLIYDFKRIKLTEPDRQSLNQRVELRNKLKCHNFEWYVYNVIPEMLDVPPMNGRYFGEIMNLHTRACWEITLDYFVGLTYFCFEHKVIPKNNFALTDDGLLRYKDKCVTLLLPKPTLKIAECPSADYEGFGVWEVLNNGPVWGSIKVTRRNEEGVKVYWCISQVTNVMSEHFQEQMPQLGPCKENDPFQMWGFTYGVDFTLVPEYLSLGQQTP